MITAFTGIRDISDRDPMVERIREAVLQEIADGATELRFGGALGADTLALAAARDQAVQRVVIVPFRVRDQPQKARDGITVHATRVIELGLPSTNKDAYFARNRRLVHGADRVVAFTDGRETGGTAYTIREARRLGIPVRIVPVEGWGA